MSNTRSRWAAIGAAVAVSVGAGGIGLVSAAVDDGPRPTYTAIEPCRILDTRPDPHGVDGAKVDAPFGAEETVTIDPVGGEGECEPLPEDVESVQLNATVVSTTMQTHFTIWAGDDPAVPNASSLNQSPDATANPNAVTVDLSEEGTFNVFNFQGEAHLVIDVVGIYQGHTHDDRYYTEDETNLLTDEIWGHWTGDAVAGAAPEGVDVVDPDDVAEGVYCVLVPARDTIHGFQATSGTPAWTVAVDPHNSGGECDDVATEEAPTPVVVYVNDGAGLAADGPFTFFAPASGLPEAEPDPEA